MSIISSMKSRVPRTISKFSQISLFGGEQEVIMVAGFLNHRFFSGFRMNMFGFALLYSTYLTVSSIQKTPRLADRVEVVVKDT